MTANKGVIAYAFGTPASIRSNYWIALLARHERCPIFTQADIQFPLEWGVDDVTYCTEKQGEPPPTLRIAREAVSWAKARGINHVIVVAARPHLARALRDTIEAFREAGMGDVIVDVYSDYADYPEEGWFCPDSTQIRTTSRKAWRQREWKLELMPFWLYKRVAS